MHRLIRTICRFLTRRHLAPGTGAVRPIGLAKTAFATLLVLLSLVSPAAAFDIDNTATVDFIYSGSTRNLNSNQVTVTVPPPPSVATAEFLHLTANPLGTSLPGTEYSNGDPPGTFTPITPNPGPGDLINAIDYFEGELVVVRVTDSDQNLDPNVTDTALVRLAVAATGDNELLRLTETGIDTGVFEGYIYAGTTAATDYNGYLTALATNLIDLNYDDGGTLLTLTNPVLAAPPGGALWLQLSANRNVVAAGDIFTYSLDVENTAVIPALGVTVTQQLPAGFRYQAGSTTLGGFPSADPTISSDGSTLIFPVGNMLPGANIEISFRTMVGAVSPGQYPSDALARASSGQVSNPAEATVLVRDELGAGKSIIAGRVLAGCGDSVGVEGVRVYMEDGTYVLTDKRGRYHVEGVKPGTHVVQLDPVTLPEGFEPVLCEDHNRFAGNPGSRFVELQPGTLWRADFTISNKPINGEVSIKLENDYAIGAEAVYTVSLSGQDVIFKNRKLEVDLPPEATYLPGTSLIDNQQLPDPTIYGNRLVYTLPDQSGKWQNRLSLSALINQESLTNELPAFARLHFDTPSNIGLMTPDARSDLIWISRGESANIERLVLRPHFSTLEASLTADDIDSLKLAIEELKELNLLKIFVSGHTDARRIRWREGIPYRDNFELSMARAKAVSEELVKQLDISAENIIVSGLGASKPIADNNTVEGMALNRRTELTILHRAVIDPENEKIEASNSPSASMKTAPENSVSIAEEQEVQMGILSPVLDSHIAHPTESIRIRIPAGLTPELYYDDILLPEDQIGFRMDEPKTKSQLLTYIGIDLGDPGKHILQVKGTGPFGNIRYEASSRIIRTGEVHWVEQTEELQNVADGKTPIKLKLNLYDSLGNTIRGKTKLELRKGTLVPVAVEDKHLRNAPETGMVWFDHAGIAEFEPVTKSGLYRITLGIKDQEETVDIHVTPEKRDWILVGLAEGTSGYNDLSGNIHPLDPKSPEKNYYDDGRIAFFAKGQIKGEWLLTMAYDSDKEDLKDRSLHQVIDPGSYYTVYGDTTDQGYEASSAEKLFIRIDRERFYAVFGDINTNMNVTELSRYNRSLTGIQSEFNGRNAGYTAFVSETAQNFIRDELRGDGTSGLYQLSQNDIVINSEKIVIETRDRFHSEQIIESQSLQRHLDYDIDYDAGTIFFKEPVQSRDHDLNPVFITIDYETSAQGAEDYTYGGRAYGRSENGDIEVGASLIHEGQNTIESDLVGVDAKFRLSDKTTVKAEWASSETTSPLIKTEGDAWLAEIEHRTSLYDLSAYMREQEADFGLGQQNSSESGSRKFGADLSYRLTPHLDIDGGFYQQEYLVSGDKRRVEEISANYHNERYTLIAGIRHAEDKLTAGVDETSDQLTFGADYHVSKKLDLTLRHEQSIDNNENRDYPTRTLVGANYKLNRSVSLFAEQEITEGDSADTADTRIGLNATPWDGGQIRTSMEQNLSEAGRRVFGNLGLLQTWQINPKLSLNFSVDRSQILSGQNLSSIHPDQPPASGSSEDFTAISSGLSYREIDWTFDTRAEYRTSDLEDRWGLFAGSIVEPETFLGLSLHGSYFTTERSDQSTSNDADLSFGLAYRPENRSWIVLNRLDLMTSEEETTTSNTSHWKIIERLNAFWRANEKNRLTFKIGTRYAADDYETIDYSGMTYLLGTEWRHDLSNRLDLGLHGSVLNVQELSQALYHSGVSVGYSPAKNFWISLGYNYSGYQDDDFSQAEYTAQGPYIKFRVKFDQNSIRDALTWMRDN